MSHCSIYPVCPVGEELATVHLAQFEDSSVIAEPLEF